VLQSPDLPGFPAAKMTATLGRAGALPVPPPPLPREWEDILDRDDSEKEPPPREVPVGRQRSGISFAPLTQQPGTKPRRAATPTSAAVPTVDQSEIERLFLFSLVWELRTQGNFDELQGDAVDLIDSRSRSGLAEIRKLRRDIKQNPQKVLARYVPDVREQLGD
jgi:hypothetical protein